MLANIGRFEQDKADLSLMALPQNLGAIQVRTIEQAVNGETPTISTVRKYHGEAVARNAIVEIIAFSAGLLNIGKNLQAHQIGFLADEILQDWYWLKIGELKFIMQQGVLGAYGELYDRLDVNMVMEWIAAYDAQRTEIVERQSQRADAEADAKEKANGNGNAKAVQVPRFVLELADKMTHPFYRVLPEFKPDEFFEKQIRQEWELKGEEEKDKWKTFEAFRFFKIEETKNLFRK